MNITDAFLEKIFEIRDTNVSQENEFRIRRFLIDTIGVTLGGSKFLKNKCEELIKFQKSIGNIKPIGYDIPVSISDAILINGLNSHYLELDDGIRYGVIHPSAPLFSALIPLAVEYNIEWNTFLKSVICGYESSIRLAYSMQPSHYNKGYHPTAICCTLGVAIACAILLGFNNQKIKNALSAACISASGSLDVIKDGSEFKSYNVAKASLLGYISALCAQIGLNGSSDPLGNEVGFLSIMTSSYEKDILMQKTSHYLYENIYQKLYASCRHTHPGIEAAIIIAKHNEFVIEDIHNINIFTYEGVIGKHDFTDINGIASAKMSIPFCVALALCTGGAGFEDFNIENVSDKTIIELTKKIHVVADDNLSQLIPKQRVAIMELHLKNGIVHSQKIEYPKGEPENPLNIEELYAKFFNLALLGGKSIENTQKIFNNIMFSEKPDLKIIW